MYSFAHDLVGRRYRTGHRLRSAGDQSGVAHRRPRRHSPRAPRTSWCAGVPPQIGFSDAEQIEFTQTLGTFVPERTGEQVYSVTLDTTVNELADYLKGSLYWHIDGTMNEVPIRASLLSSKVVCPDGSGDTEFANTYAAYDALDDADKDALESLRVMHSAWNTLFYYDPEPSYATLRKMMAIGDRELPLVWNHRSGRRSLVFLGVYGAPRGGHRLPQERRTACPIAGLGYPA